MNQSILQYSFESEISEQQLIHFTKSARFKKNRPSVQFLDEPSSMKQNRHKNSFTKKSTKTSQLLKKIIINQKQINQLSNTIKKISRKKKCYVFQLLKQFIISDSESSFFKSQNTSRIVFDLDKYTKGLTSLNNCFLIKQQNNKVYGFTNIKLYYKNQKLNDIKISLKYGMSLVENIFKKRRYVYYFTMIYKFKDYNKELSRINTTIVSDQSIREKHENSIRHNQAKSLHMQKIFTMNTQNTKEYSETGSYNINRFFETEAFQNNQSKCMKENKLNQLSFYEKLLIQHNNLLKPSSKAQHQMKSAISLRLSENPRKSSLKMNTNSVRISKINFQ